METLKIQLPIIKSRQPFNTIGELSVSDPDSIRSEDPDPGGLKMPIKIEKVKKFHVLKCWIFSFHG
jgi:hypothetical protein